MNEDYWIDEAYEDRSSGLSEDYREPEGDDDYHDYGHRPEQFPDWPDFD